MSFFDHNENTPVVGYGPFDDEAYAMFYRVCPKCGRFVKPDEKSQMPEYLGKKPNATCKRCGRVQMEFCTWNLIEDEAEWAYTAHLNPY